MAMNHDQDLVAFMLSGRYAKATNVSVRPFFAEDDVRLILIYHILSYTTLAMVPVILFNNSLVFWGMMLYPGFKTQSDMLLTSLCIADFLMGALTIPVYFLRYNKSTSSYIEDYKYTCLLMFSTVKFSVDGSLWTLLIISFERYIAVMWPQKYRSLVTRNRIKVTLLILWTYLVILAFAPVFGLNNYNPDEISGSRRCSYFLVMKRYYIIWSSFITKAVCLAIPFALYTQILYVMYRQLQHLDHEIFNSPESRELKKRVVMVKITSTLTFFFIFSWTPFLFISLSKYYRIFPQTGIEIAANIVKIATTANAMINAPIYAYAWKEYRNTYKTMLTNFPWRWKFQLQNLYAGDLSASGLGYSLYVRQSGTAELEAEEYSRSQTSFVQFTHRPFSIETSSR